MRLELNVKLKHGRFDVTTDLSAHNTGMGVLGKSGAGKTTLLGLIAGTIQAETGHISLDRKILFSSRKGISVPQEQRPVGAVLQLDSWNSDTTVKDTLASAYRQTPKDQRILKPRFIIEVLGLESTLGRSSKHISSGERQRVAIAQCLLKSPKLLLLDDTFAVIGNTHREQLLAVLRQLQNETGMCVLYASQSLGDILELTDQVIILEAGSVVRTGSLRDFAQEHGILRYLGMVPVENILPVKIESHEPAGGCTLANLFGIPLVLPMRPHLRTGSQIQVSIKSADIALSRNHLEGISIQNQIKGRICALVPSGEKVFVQIDCGSILLAEITLRAVQEMRLQEGDTVYCLVKTHAVTYLSEFDARAANRVINQADGNYFIDPSTPSVAKVA